MNKQTGYGAYFPWWVSVIIPGHRDAFRAYGDTVLALRHMTHHCPALWICVSGFSILSSPRPPPEIFPVAFGVWGMVQGALCQATLWHSFGAWKLYSDYTGSGVFVWVLSGFLLGVTHLKSLLWLARPSGSKNLLHSHFLFGNSWGMTRQDLWSRETFLCWAAQS